MSVNYDREIRRIVGLNLNGYRQQCERWLAFEINQYRRVDMYML